ncbi:WecB/TagA/CpsF family glycosyltransferase [Microvirga aerilata]|uniref:WecB/TagA/CpsF family glycosyltransferase n=1 Tax=Microvirga aerilata TaxID=670292 RepID=A0A936ZCP9_9HYPH|nr:WecB/TagA/CpsF family glycosyltransferase [Microvirga aerilata]MBL0404389.1 WecB/TagA/CpsF family glycosyltransferase [Microvirga aerilata]
MPNSESDRPSRTILGVEIEAWSLSDAIEFMDRRVASSEATCVAFANTNLLNHAYEDPEFRRVLGQFVVLNDGVGLDIASRLLYGAAFPENLNGTDFIPEYLRRSQHRHRIFLLGGKPGVAERAALAVSKLSGQHDVVGSLNGYSDLLDTKAVLDTIVQAQASLLLVAMGNPKQEFWLSEHLVSTGCKLGFGVGALFDFLAGDVARAPQIIQRMRLEWAFRLAQEPRRLTRRYSTEMALFLGRVLSKGVM